MKIYKITEASEYLGVSIEDIHKNVDTYKRLVKELKDDEYIKPI